MKYRIKSSGKFKKSFKLALKRGKDPQLLSDVLNILAESGVLPKEYRSHVLSGNYKGIWECHLESDWLLLWRQYDDELVLLLTDTGTHSDLFKK